MKIAIIGTHGVGKTTLCYDVAAAIKKQDKNVDIVKEVSRSCPLPINKDTTKSAQAWILHTQIAKEIESQSVHDVVICDRSVLDNYAYLVHKTGRDAMLDKLISSWMKTYDFIFKIPITDNLTADRVRDTDAKWQSEINNIVDELADEFKINFVELSKNKADWMNEILAAVMTKQVL